MNSFTGIIRSIEIYGIISRLSIDASGVTFDVVTLSLPETLAIGKKVTMIFKETEVTLAEEKSIDISMTNAVECSVKSIVKGACFWDVNLDSPCGNLTVIVFSEWGDKHRINDSSAVLALIKASDIAVKLI